MYNTPVQYILEAKVSPLRKKQLKSTMNHVKRFNEDTTFESLNLDKFENYLTNDTGKDDKKNKSLNTISGILKRMRAFISYARDKNWTSVNPFENFTIGEELYGDPVYLTKTERDFLYDAVIPIEILAQVRDMFVLQCFIGARISDFMKLTKDNIVNDAIEYVPAKTVNESFKKVRIPLSEKAKAIINKYNIPDGSLLPFIPDQRYNVYLKDLFQLCKLNRPVVRLNPLTRENETVPLYKMANSHMARRTFIGILHKKAKNEVIASMSGHVENSKAFARYYNIDEEDQNEAITSIE
jgi:site-specific recombinase XerD